MQIGEFFEALKKAVERNGKGTVERLCATQAGLLKRSKEPFPQEQVASILELLRSHRRFAEMLVLSEVFVYRNDSPFVNRAYGQALIENGQLLAAIQWLLKCESEIRQSGDTGELPELAGLLGRAYKQLYSERDNPDDLRSSLIWYHYLYSIKPSEIWPGVNVACLGALAAERGISLKTSIDHRKFAIEVLKTIAEISPEERDHWCDISAAEALIALDRAADAIEYVNRFCDHPNVDAFALGSALRQFEELWKLDDRDDDYLGIMDRLRSSLMRREGGLIVTEVETLNHLSANYEKLFTGAGPLPRSWFLRLLDCAACVGRVWAKDQFGCGTGFVIWNGGDLWEPWSGLPVFVTCNHVVSDRYNVEGALFSNEVTITFDSLVESGSSNPRRYTVEEVLWESPRTEWDVTIVLLEEAEDCVIEKNRGRLNVDLVKESRRIPSSSDDRVYIIGHPGGGEMSFTFQDNQCIGSNERRIQYIAPTSPGNSGSPVFDQHLNLIAMHHAGGEFMKSLEDPSKTIQANQGIPLPSIIKAIQNSGQNQMTPDET